MSHVKAPAWHQHVQFGLSVLFVTAGLWIGAQFLLASIGAKSADAATARCPQGGVKLERGPWVWTAAGGDVIESVCVKAGTQTYSFYADGSRDCYTVTGLGTATVEVSGGGTSRWCKAVSHVVFYTTKQ